jgi:hypothetical protein
MPPLNLQHMASGMNNGGVTILSNGAMTNNGGLMMDMHSDD